MPPKGNEKCSWHPVYCRLASIIGLEEEQDRCKEILNKLKVDGKVIVLVRVSDDWLFGQCNFKADPKDGYNLKFIDTMQTIIGRDLEIFAQGGVSKLIFIEKDLFETFEARRDKDFETFVLNSVLFEAQ
jgi:hypothetical protein